MNIETAIKNALSFIQDAGFEHADVYIDLADVLPTLRQELGPGRSLIIVKEWPEPVNADEE